MSIFFSILVVVVGILGIFLVRRLTDRSKVRLLADTRLNDILKFQLLNFLWASAILLVAYWQNPANFGLFFRIGDLQARASKIPWLGISGQESWTQVFLTLGIFVTLGTSLFMFVHVKRSKATFRLTIALVLWSLLFSALNAFSEEAIFRLAMVSPLYGTLALPLLALLSGLLFGLPHYFGQPSGVVGVLMAGFLGWLLALAMLGTQGMFLAWALHFVQDVVIFVSMFAITLPEAQSIA